MTSSYFRLILLGQAVCDCGVFLLQEKVAETAALLRALANASRVASRALSRVREWPEQPEPRLELEDEQKIAELLKVFDT
jgi:hypothetical protein